MKSFTAMMASAALFLMTAFAMANVDTLKSAYQRPRTIAFPANNPYTVEKAVLGKMLFFDARLSRDNNLSCASCHNPSFGWQVPFAKAIGAGGKPLARKSPTTINHAWGDKFFWDGRANSLESQAQGPIESPAEMDLPLSVAVERLRAISGYKDAFASAFPSEGLTEKTILEAISTYERTIVTGDTPFDRWIRGDQDALTPAAIRGFEIFNGKAKCVSCHSGWNFTYNKFHDIGLATTDKGRAVITGQAKDMHATRTPGLRDIVARAPYMHNGSLATLQEVMAHYVFGGVSRPSRSPFMQATNLTGQDISDVITFLHSLTSDDTTTTLPNLPAR